MCMHLCQEPSLLQKCSCIYEDVLSVKMFVVSTEFLFSRGKKFTASLGIFSNNSQDRIENL